MSLDNMTADEVQFWRKGLEDAMSGIERDGLYRCPVCKHLTIGKPCNHSICASCGVEFGYDAEHYCKEIPEWEPKL